LLAALLLAGRSLGLLEGAVGALDGLLKLGQRAGDVRAGELVECLGRDVLVRAPAGGGRALAGGDDEPGGVLLGGDDDQRAPVELAGGLGAVDELPQPRQRGLRVAVLAVVDAQPAAAAVLTRLGDVGAQVLDDESDAASGDPRDPRAGLRVGRVVVVGAQQRVTTNRATSMLVGSTLARLGAAPVAKRAARGQRWRGVAGRSRERWCSWSGGVLPIRGLGAHRLRLIER
jgi:hypothetical protein